MIHSRHPIHAALATTALAAAGLLLSACGVEAQHGASLARAAARCDRAATTAIVFGHIGGTLKPTGLRIAPDGSVTPVGSDSGAGASRRTVPVRQLHRLARHAWSSAFVRLPTAPTRPTRNPDAARDFVELRSACGRKHVEYAGGEGPPAFRDLYRQLVTLTALR